MFIKLLRYLAYHLTTWNKMSKVTPFFNSPVRNHQHPYPFSGKSCEILIKILGYFPYHLTTWSMMSKMTHPSSLQSGTSTSSQVPNLSFLSKIMSDLDKTFRIWPSAITNIILNVKIEPILQSPSQEQLTSSYFSKYILKPIISRASSFTDL